jgi:NADP-reducing hydrogenase subunit HndB
MKSLADLQKIREDMQKKMSLRKEDESDIRVVVGMATCGIAAAHAPFSPPW